MDKIIRQEFTGNPYFYWILVISIIGAPLARIYRINTTVTLESEVEDAEAFMVHFRKNELRNRI